MLGRCVHTWKQQRIHSNALRWKVTSLAEPPLDSDVLEKPYTLILMEDPYQLSWHSSWLEHVPRRYGMEFGGLTVDWKAGFSALIEELKDDLSGIPDTLLVTRGPLSSWAAKFYLESFPLQGLIMVDPIMFDQENEESIADLFQRAHGVDLKNHANDDGSLQKLVDEAREKTLKLEPNSVPMAILQSNKDPVCTLASEQVALRHGDMDGPFGKVEHMICLETDPLLPLQKINEWADIHLL